MIILFSFIVFKHKFFQIGVPYFVCGTANNHKQTEEQVHQRTNIIN